MALAAHRGPADPSIHASASTLRGVRAALTAAASTGARSPVARLAGVATDLLTAVRCARPAFRIGAAAAAALGLLVLHCTGAQAGGIEIDDTAASPVAGAAARDLVDRMTVRPDVAERLRSSQMHLRLDPAGGQVGCDEMVRCAVPASGFELAPDPAAATLATNLLADRLRLIGLPTAEEKKITEAFDARQKTAGPWRVPTAGADVAAYWADATTAWFDPVASDGRDWIRAHDRRLYALLRAAYPTSAADLPGITLRATGTSAAAFKNVEDQVRRMVRRPDLIAGLGRSSLELIPADHRFTESQPFRLDVPPEREDLPVMVLGPDGAVRETAPDHVVTAMAKLLHRWLNVTERAVFEQRRVAPSLLRAWPAVRDATPGWSRSSQRFAVASRAYFGIPDATARDQLLHEDPVVFALLTRVYSDETPRVATERLPGLVLHLDNAAPGIADEVTRLARRMLVNPEIIGGLERGRTTLVLKPPYAALESANEVLDLHAEEAVRWLAARVHDAMPGPLKRRLEEAFRVRRAAGGPWPSGKPAASAARHFADATVAYLGLAGSGPDAGWLELHDGPLLEVLRETYGATSATTRSISTPGALIELKSATDADAAAVRAAVGRLLARPDVARRVDEDRLFLTVTGDRTAVRHWARPLTGAILAWGIPPSERAAVKAAYEARRLQGGPWVDPDAALDASSYFFHASLAFLDDAPQGRAWLKRSDPAGYEALSAIYRPGAVGPMQPPSPSCDPLPGHREGQVVNGLTVEGGSLASARLAGVAEQLLRRPDLAGQVKTLGTRFLETPPGVRPGDLPGFRSDDPHSLGLCNPSQCTVMAVDLLAGGVTQDHALCGGATHEIGHVALFALPITHFTAVVKAFTARRVDGGPWVTGYAPTNFHEYWAEGTAAYTGRLTNGHGPAWLRENDPTLFELLRAAYPTEMVEVEGLSLVRTDGVSEQAWHEAGKLARGMLHRPDIARKLRAKRASLQLLPRGPPPFPLESLARKSGRFVTEQDLGPADIARFVFDVGLSDRERWAIWKLLDDRSRTDGPWPGGSPPVNEREYFAQLSTAYLTGLPNGVDATWLQANEPDLVERLGRVYPVEPVPEAPWEAIESAYEAHASRFAPWVTPLASESPPQYWAEGLRAIRGEVPGGAQWLRDHDPTLLRLLSAASPPRTSIVSGVELVGLGEHPEEGWREAIEVARRMLARPDLAGALSRARETVEIVPGGVRRAASEIARALFDGGLARRERWGIKDSFERRVASGGPWPGGVPPTDAREYFEQLSLAHLQTPGGPTWLEVNEPEMARRLSAIYPERPIPEAQAGSITAAYEARAGIYGPWVTPLAKESAAQYWAEGVRAVHGELDRGPAWLQQEDPALFTLLRAAYPLRSHRLAGVELIGVGALSDASWAESLDVARRMFGRTDIAQKLTDEAKTFDVRPGGRAQLIAGIARAILDTGLTMDERWGVQVSFGRRLLAGGPWPAGSPPKDEFEYFAQLSTAYLEGRPGDVDASWLERNEPEMLRRLSAIYPEQAIPEARWSALTRAYDARAARFGPWVTPLAKESAAQYWAEGVRALRGELDRGPAWLRERDPEMLALLLAAFPERTGAVPGQG